MKKYRIFLGMGDVAGQLKDYEKGFEKLGHKVTTCVVDKNFAFRDLNYDYELPFIGKRVIKDWIPNPFLRYSAKIIDRLIIDFKKLFLSPMFIKNHDVFIFVCGGISLFNNHEFPLLKKLNKKIVSILVGSEVRHISAFKQKYGGDFSTWEKDIVEANLNQKISTLRTSEKYSDVIWSVIDQSDLGLRPYHHFIIPVDVDKYNFKIPKRDIPLIIHAPSRSGIKGTDKIVATLEKLKAEGLKFELEVIKNMPNKALLEKLTEADILIDEIYLFGPAKLGFEAMASGCAVANRYLEGSFPYCKPPICHIDSDNLYESFKKLIIDKEYRISLAENGIDFIKKYQTPEKVCQRIINCLEGIEPYDYYPGFFLDNFQIEKNQKISEKNIKRGKEIVLKYGAASKDSLKRGIEKGLIKSFTKKEISQINFWKEEFDEDRQPLFIV